jgi:hypothetical protein
VRVEKERPVAAIDPVHRKREEAGYGETREAPEREPRHRPPAASRSYSPKATIQ